MTGRKLQEHARVAARCYELFGWRTLSERVSDEEFRASNAGEPVVSISQIGRSAIRIEHARGIE